MLGQPFVFRLEPYDLSLSIHQHLLAVFEEFSFVGYGGKRGYEAGFLKELVCGLGSVFSTWFLAGATGGEGDGCGCGGVFGGFVLSSFERLGGTARTESKGIVGVEGGMVLFHISDSFEGFGTEVGSGARKYRGRGGGRVGLWSLVRMGGGGQLFCCERVRVGCS